ncbi:MAG: AtpZ/AtpI family protein [Steroidobacteraceae bacterium]|jgi:ATP synthase protein I
MADEEPALLTEVAAKARRKIQAQRAGPPGVWSGLGMSGLIGWSVALPTLAGGMLGLWLDKQHPGHRSWTLMLLMSGLILGCANAWHWVAQENTAIQRRQQDAARPEDKDE